MSAKPDTPTRASRGRGATATTNFGSGRRESHDASAFYERFVAPEVTSDSTVERIAAADHDQIFLQDARNMVGVPDNSVALVVTSPPYFAGKAYEEELGVGGVPADYFEYLELLHSVFSECARVLEPGGRIAVNIANLGRRPYRSLSADVTTILQDLGLLLRGEVVWWKGRAAGGSCAWGTFQRPSNPVLRDVTERIVIASKGRFDRALTPTERLERGLPSTATISRDEFMEATTDLWEIAPESATRVGHPAPFPVDLPKRLIELYTYEGDVVLDPFMGSGSTAVAAVRTGRHYFGFDTDASYIDIANGRVDAERARLDDDAAAGRASLKVELLADKSAPGGEGLDVVATAVRQGRQARELAEALLVDCGFDNLRSEVKLKGAGVALSVVATDQTGEDWAFDVSGSFTTNRSGLRRADTLWKTLGTAGVLAEHQRDQERAMPLVLLTTEAPAKGSSGYQALRSMTGPSRPVFDVVELLSVEGRERLEHYAQLGKPQE